MTSARSGCCGYYEKGNHMKLGMLELNQMGTNKVRRHLRAAFSPRVIDDL
jgi:hypothetical protein